MIFFIVASFLWICIYLIKQISKLIVTYAFLESMSHEFLDKVLDMVENPASVEHDDQCTDALVNLLLAYNLHFPFQEANDIMSILAKKGTVKVFTEKLLEIFNKGGKKIRLNKLVNICFNCSSKCSSKHFWQLWIKLVKNRKNLLKKWIKKLYQ